MKLVAACVIFSRLLIADLAGDISEFSLSFYHQLEEEDTVASPFSIFSCLSMAYIGAEGSTASEMASALQLTMPPAVLSKEVAAYLAKIDHVDHPFRIGNSLWLGNRMIVLSSYRSMVEDDFRAAVQGIDFSDPAQAALTINTWISAQTDGKIPNLIGPHDLSSATRMLLANAIYFKGSWQIPFDPQRTALGSFASEKALMIEQTALFKYLETNTAQIAALPFKKQKPDFPDTAFILILPKSDASFELSTSLLEDWLHRLKPVRLHLRMPKFTLDKRLSLSPILKKLGMKAAFLPSADFSGIDGQRDLFLSQALHQAFFALDEAGVTAAAATATSMATTSLPPPVEAELIADRPFIFLLMDMSALIPIFIGKLSHAPRN